MEAARHPWPALGVLLIRDGLVTPEELEEVLVRQGDDRDHRISSQRLGEALVETGRVTTEQIARLVAEQHELPFVDLTDPDATVPVPVHLPEDVARLHSALPVRSFPDGSVLVVVADPTRTGCFDDIRRTLGAPVRFAVAVPDAIEAAIDAKAARVAELPAEESEEADESSAFGDDDSEAAAVDKSSMETPAESDTKPWPVLGSLLVRNGLVTEEELAAALAQQRLSSTRRLGEILVARGTLTDVDLSRALAEQHELAFVDLREHEIDFAAASRLPLDVARAHVALPISTLPDGALLVAVADPASAIHSEELRSALGGPTQFAIAPLAQIDAAIDSVHAGGNGDGADEDAVIDAFGLAGVPVPVLADDGAAASEDEGSEPERLEEPEGLLELETDEELETVGEPEIVAAEPETEHEPTPEDKTAPSFAPFPELELVATEPETATEHESDTESHETFAVELEAVPEPEPEPEPEAETETEGVTEPEIYAVSAQGEGAVSVETVAEPHREPVTVAIERAFALGASAVHFVPRRDGMAVLGRVDGVLSELEAIPPERDDEARSELAELTRRPLHAFQVGEQSVALRSAVLPTLDGDRVTFRVVDETAPQGSFFELVERTGAAEALQEALDRGSGLLVFCGPAGSGRTTTLRAALAELGCAHRAVMTIEDPVEQLIPGADQTEVDPSRGLTYASGLRAILRSDPDIVVVGELGDTVTTSLAARGALGGRFVLTTLEAESASAGIRRLLDLGLEPRSLAQALAVVVAQRLVGRVCPECRESYYASAAELTELGRPPEELGRRLLGRGQGCDACGGSRYAGHVGAFEVLPVSDAVRELVTLGATADEIEHAAVASGMRTLLEDAVELCLEGLTTPAEVRQIAGLYR